MFAIQYTSKEADEVQSLSSSSLSNDSLQLQHFMMDEDQSYMYSDFDWSMSSSPQQQQQDMTYWSHTMFTQATDPTHFVNKPRQSPPPSSSYENINNRVHPRFKSANARLDSSYQQFIHPSVASSPLVDLPPVSTDVFYNNNDFSNETGFQFNIVLDAPTAITKKHDEEQVTYLNRGQAYLLEFESSCMIQGTLSTTISIAFHEPSHRVISKSYWKYWIAQQEIPSEARAIELDMHQTSGIYNIRLTSFDRITFDWHNRFGAKVYIRFNCLSTDFSKIKGVKGIPMRIVAETTQHVMTMPHDITPYKGTFQKITAPPSGDFFEYKESCYCKIKLFRDKGAERKNKDDRKQKDKQIDKVIASTKGNPEQHPLWPILSQKHKSKSCFIEIPPSPELTPQQQEHSLFLFKNERQQQKKTVLTFYVWTVNFNSSPQEIVLETFKTQNLKSKLAQVLDIHPARISEILWHRKKQTQDESDVLVLVEDTFIEEHISDGEMMTVNWEMKTDGSLRLILEF